MGALPALELLAALVAAAAAAFCAARAALGKSRRLHGGSDAAAASPAVMLLGRRLPTKGFERGRGLLAARLVAVGRRLARVPAARRLRENTVGRRKKEALQACIPEALRLLGTALESGSSLPQALRYAAENCAEPLAGELMDAVWDLEAGRSFDEAMSALRERTGGSQFAYLAVVMEIQHKSGGSLGGVIASVSESLRVTAKLAETLETKTAQGRLSARIVTVAPIVLLVVLSVSSGDYFMRFFESVHGVLLLVLAVLLEVVGVLLVRRALAVDLTHGVGGAA